MSHDSIKPACRMTLDELFAVGNQINQTNAACGMPLDGRNFLLENWIDGLVDYCDVSVAVANALASRWMLKPRWEAAHDV